MAMIAPPPQQAQNPPCDPLPGCRVQTKYDLAFMLDRSGSLALRGQTWNIMVDGVVRALRDSTVIPRDGSIAVSVVVFDGAANLIVPLTDIKTASDANNIANQVDLLKCTGNIKSQIFPCPAGETSWFAGILTANNHVNQFRSGNPKPGARRVLLLVSDGQTTPGDLSEATQLAEQDRANATLAGISLTFDAFLMGVDPQSAEFASNKAALDQIVTPIAVNNPPGTTTVINPGDCNLEGATFTSSDCSRQAKEFAERTRGILRSDVPSISLVVGLEADTLPGAVVGNLGPSLRQAIEQANCNGGAASISFNVSLRGKTINLLASLPALAAPDIVINGCDAADPQGCPPLVTINGGGLIADGITIRSNRDVIRGLRIVNFTHAGIVIAPACPADNISQNLIERNVLENNPTGVLVNDDRTPPRDGFNERNTISRNNITRAAPPADPPAPALIDLGGNGPTPNDAGDPDHGPNTLLNFPDSLSVVSSGAGTVTITGQIGGPTVTGATIELFAVTASHIVSGNLVIDGVTFLAQTKADTCSVSNATLGCTFTATGVPVSPTGNYTATVTDSLGNTSELMFRADGKPAAGPDASFSAAVDFGSVTLTDVPQSKPFEIVNNGNAPLQITGCSVARCAPADKDDTAGFTIAGCPSPTSQINPGEHVTITVSFLANVCGAAKACLILANNDLLHAPITSTLTGQVISNAAPAVALEGNAGSLVFGPVSARSQRRGVNKVIKKQAFHTFTVDNKGCNTFNVTSVSIKRVTDVPKCITSANADDSNLWVLTLLKSGVETRIVTGGVQPGLVLQIAPRETLTFRVRFNPAVPAVVSKTCPDGKLIADEVLPDEVSSAVNLTVSGAGVSNTLAVPLTGRVTKDVRLINPSDPSQSPVVSLCSSGNDFIVQFSVYDSNQNVDRANFQFMDSAGRILALIDVTGLDQVVASRNLAIGQSFTVLQRFTGAADNRSVVNVQVRVFDKDGSEDAVTSGPVNTGCSGVTAQQLQSSLSSTLTLPQVVRKNRLIETLSKMKLRAE
jgi:uncharacterized protein YegL